MAQEHADGAAMGRADDDVPAERARIQREIMWPFIYWPMIWVGLIHVGTRIHWLLTGQ